MEIFSINRQVYRHLGVMTWAQLPNPATVPAGTRANVSDRGGSTWEARGSLWRPSEQARQKATAAHLLSKYASTRDASLYGVGTRPRGLSRADDIPSLISSSTADPATDVDDPATRRINIINGYAYETWATIPATKEDFLAPRGYYRGVNEILDQARYANGIQVVGKVTSPGGTAPWASTTLEPGAVWGLGTNYTVVSFVTYGSVFYINPPSYGSIGAVFFVNGEPVVPTALGGNMATPAGLPFVMKPPGANNWVKVKFPTAARRVIHILQMDTTLTATIKVPATDVIHGNPTKVRVGFFGDSFTDHIIADSSPSVRSDSWAHVFLTEYGLDFELLDFALGGSGFVGNGNNLTMVGTPTSGYVNGRVASHRKALRLATSGLDLDMVLCLGCHNDDVTLPEFKSEVRAFWEEAREMHPNAILIQAGTNASPAQISSGLDLVNEQALAEACAEVGVKHIPMQAGVSRLFTGTGKQSAPNGSGNTDVLTGSDGVHPTIAGHTVIGKYLADRVAEYLGEFV